MRLATQVQDQDGTYCGPQILKVFDASYERSDIFWMHDAQEQQGSLSYAWTANASGQETGRTGHSRFHRATVGAIGPQ